MESTLVCHIRAADQGRFSIFDTCLVNGTLRLSSDIVHAVASIPDSFDFWFYGDKCHEAGKAFGCLVRVSNLDPVQRHHLQGGQWWQQTANASE